jgi:hypothetical protein
MYEEKIMRILAYTLMVFLAMSTLAKAQDTEVSKIGAFHISSLNSPFAMQGIFEGEYQVYPNRIAVKLAKADITLTDRSPYKGRRLLSTVTFSLTTMMDDKRWKIVYHGQAYSLERVMSPGDTVKLAEIDLSIPMDETIDLSKYWLVVEMAETLLDAPGEKCIAGYSYAHSRRDIFFDSK